MLVSELDFRLPQELIATGPLPARGKGARLLVLHRDTGEIEHRQFPDVVEYLKGQPVYVNNARLFRGNITVWEPKGQALEASLIYQVDPLTWEAYVRGDERLVAGKDLTLADGSTMHVGERAGPRYVVRFDQPPDLEAIGDPVVPAFSRKMSGRAEHPWWEPVYASKSKTGTASSPGAGVHFTPEILAQLDVRELTLFPDCRVPYTMGNYTVEYHAGLVKPEPYQIPDPPAGPVAAVGTTVCKALETFARTGEAEGKSALFIHEPFEFKRTAKLLTNFAFPRESFLALHIAFGGYERVMKAYRVAVEEKYRWYAYGDSLLIV